MSKICCTKALGVLFFIFCSLIINGQEQLAPSDTLRNVRLREVVVTATQPDAPGTSSLIGQDAIRHIQATDLSDPQCYIREYDKCIGNSHSGGWNANEQ